MVDIKKALVPVDTKVLSTWADTAATATDCSKWLGVTCDATGNVQKM